MKKLLLAALLFLAAGNLAAMVWETNKVYHSDSVGRDLRYGVLLPSGYNWQTNKYYPVIYFLHGRDESDQTWYEEAYATFMGTDHTNEFIMIFPQGSRWKGGVYENSWFEYGNGYMGAVCRDLPKHIAQKYRVKNIRGVSGVSMGGYAAFRIAGCCDAYFNCRYCAASSMSGAFVGPKISKLLDGVNTLQTNELATAVAPKKFIKLFFDCGDQDIWLGSYNLAEINMDMANCLISMGRRKNVDLVFSRPAGEHDWKYWRSRIPEHLDHFSKQLALFPDIKILIDGKYEDEDEVPAVQGKYTLTGTAEFADGIKKVTVKQVSASGTKDLVAEGTTNWQCELTLEEGANKIKAYAIANNGYTNWAFVNLRVPKEAKPEIEILSHKAGEKYFTYEETIDIYGTAYADSGVSNVYLSVKSQRGEGDTYVSTNCVNWAFTAKLYKGNNALRVYAVSGHHLTNNVAITVFRGSKDFRIKKVIVNKKRTGLNFYISNITQTNLVSVSPNGEGSVTIGPLTFPLEQGAWTKANTFVSNYKKKTSDDKVAGKIHSKPNKDFFQCNLKTLTTSSAYCEGLQNIPFNSSVPFKVRIGDYEVSTNVFLDSQGKFKSNAPWF
jgi:S-formylglutathione hydrolase FrmB